MKVKLTNLDGSAGKGDIELSDAVFGLEPRADILHRVVTWQLENRRGTARAARERSDVARTGKKFGRQKGGGTARHGDRKAPIFIGGGKAHGPRRRDFDQSLNKKVRALGQIRGAHPVLGRGRRVTVSSDADTWVYRMTGCGDEDVLVAINKADAPRSVTLPAGSYENLVAGGNVSGGSTMLGARSFLILGPVP